MLKVTNVKVLSEQHLRVGFNDGLVRDVDCSFLFHGPLGEQLRDPEYFGMARIDEEAGTVVWPNGLDPAPEILHGDLETIGPASVEQRGAVPRTTAEEIANATGGPFTEPELDAAHRWLPAPPR
jgi:hypothetical protein